MRIAGWTRTRKFGVATLAGLGLVWFLIAILPAVSLADAGNVMVPSTSADRPAGIPLALGVSIVKSARTAESSSGGSVSDGGWITYTIRLQNANASAIDDVTITDILPNQTLEEGNIQCLGAYACGMVQETELVKDRNGNTIATVVTTKRITWGIGSLAAGAVVTREFRGRVVCHPDGFTFQNGALATFTLQGEIDSETSNAVRTTVEVAAPVSTGGSYLSNGPTWCSTETGGTWDMDWGDYDADGDLDLLLGSETYGAVVYRNDEGELTRVGPVHAGELWSVRWADFNNDGLLDILVTGDYAETPTANPPSSAFYPGSYPYMGRNYIYKNAGNGEFTLHDNGSGYTFQTSDSTAKAAIADYDSDGDVDIAIVNPYGGCTVEILKNISPTLLGNAPPGNNVFQAAVNWNTDNTICLLADKPAASLGWADYNNDGYLDLGAAWQESGAISGSMVGLFPQNVLHGFSSTPAFTFSITGTVIADIAWGDYNNDGLLDLAMAYQGVASLGTSSQVNVYRNWGGEFVPSLATLEVAADAPTAVDFFDVNSDGRLELALGDSPPRMYDPLDPATPLITVPMSGDGPFYGLRAVDTDNDGDLEVSLADLSGRSLLFTNFGSFLDKNLTGIDDSTPGTSLACEDLDGDGMPDFLIGSNSSINTLHYNRIPVGFGNPTEGDPFDEPFLVGGRIVAVGDVNNDDSPDIVFGRTNRNHIYLSGSWVFPFPDWTADVAFNAYGVALADFNQDDSGWLDMVTANGGATNNLYLNTGSGFGSVPSWNSGMADLSRGVAWGYLEQDVFPDFAVANYAQPTRIYRYNGVGGFDLVQELPATKARGVDWGDFDGDGDMDLAVGNYDQKTVVYQNLGGSFDVTPVWSSPESRPTTSVAWGDWNNDGELDLAVGNDGRYNQVFANMGSTPGDAKLYQQWESQVAYNTQDVQWCDFDKDGDVDLAIASNASGDSWNGYYVNGYLSSAHLNNKYMPRYLNSTYVQVSVPLPSEGHIWHRSAYSLTDPTSLVIPVEFAVYDPDGPYQNGGTRDDVSLIPGQYAITSELEYKFSTNGGGTWHDASTDSLTYDQIAQQYTVRWQAGQDLGTLDRAVSDRVQFLVSTAHINKSGPVERARTAGMSPAFRVRNLSCVWPEDAFLTYSPPVSTGVSTLFHAYMTWSGGLTVSWDFGEGTIFTTGVKMAHTFATSGTHVVTMTAMGDACPMTRPTYATDTVNVAWSDKGGGEVTPTMYLPIVQRTMEDEEAATVPVIPDELLALDLTQESPTQVQGLTGSWSRAGADLSWEAVAGEIEGYRIYRAVGSNEYSLLADLAADSTTFFDDGAGCGCAYFVTAFSAGGESLPSTSSYATPPCGW